MEKGNIRVMKQFSLDGINSIKKRIFSVTLFKSRREHFIPEETSQSQNLAPYWDSGFPEDLETWGEGNTWEEIQFLLSGCEGKILDVACGNGKVISLLTKFQKIEIFGCDISDFLIQKAIDRGIEMDKLCVCDATKMKYTDNFFNFSYSIGSLEHFSDNGIEKCIRECRRVTLKNSCHMVPVSRSGTDEGWTTTIQSFHNNSTEWWKRKFLSFYKDVIVLDSRWHDDLSIGKWFICFK